MSQKKAYVFNPKKHISIIGFIAAAKLACYTNFIHELAALWVFFHHVNETLAKSLNNRMWHSKNLVLFRLCVKCEQLIPKTSTIVSTGS